MSTCSDSTLSPGKLLETDDYIMCQNLDEKDDLTGNESYDSITETTNDCERKIKAFLDDKAHEFKKMQKLLYEEFYNILNKAAASPSYVDNTGFKATPRLTCSERQRKWKEELDQELQRKREMRRQAGAGGKTSVPKDRALTRQRERTRLASPGSGESRIGYFQSYDSITETTDDCERKIKAFLDDKAQEFKKMQKLLYEEFDNSLNKEAASPSYVDNTGFKATPRLTCSERQRKWKEELDQELQRKREMRREAGAGGKTSVPKDRALTRQREQTRLASPDSGESRIGYF